VPVTVAVNCRVFPPVRAPLVGDNETPRVFNVTLALADFVASAALVAVTVTFCVPEIEGGAV
jgi:hypothetical protein